MKLVSGELMSKIDRYTIENVGIPGPVLMENAGKDVFKEFIYEFNPDKTSSVLIICGKGNNGGDGFVVARYLFNNKFENIIVILLANSSELKGDALINYNICKNLGVKIFECKSWEIFNNITLNKKFNFIFDAILGTGLKSEVRDLYKKIIDFINSSDAKVISVDIPSGLHSETGLPLGTAVNADLTCTFAYKKIGLSTYPGVLYAGNVKVIDISIPDNLPFTVNHFEIDESLLNYFYKKRAIDAHKGIFGHALILGGSIGFTGAPVLCSIAALKAGCGLATAIVPESINSTIESLFIEGMSYPVDFENYDKKELLDFINSKSAILIGPGLGQSKEAKELVLDILPEIEIPLIIDADGLNIISERIDILNRLRVPPVLTPHPGEMSRLIRKPTKFIQENRIAVSKEFSEKFKVTLILKGFRTVITNNGKVYICPKGNSSIATAGSGDVLAGIITSFLSQGYNNEEAAVLSTYIHGLAGEIAANKRNEHTVIASQIIENLHHAFNIIFK